MDLNTSEQQNAPYLSLMFCPRPFIGDYLKGSVNNTVMKPMRKMGEITSWDPLMRSFVSLGCRVRVSSKCTAIDKFLFEKEHGDSTVDEKRLVVVDELTSNEIHYSKKCREGTKQKTVVVGWDKAVYHKPMRMLTTFQSGQHGSLPIGSYTNCPYRGEPKEFYGVLWGKINQGYSVKEFVRQVTELTGVPIVSTCVENCHRDLPHNFPYLPAANYKRLIARALFVVGVKAPPVGASVPEVLACGTFIIGDKGSFSAEHRRHPLVKVTRNRGVMLHEIVQLVEKFLENEEGDAPMTNPVESMNHSTKLSERFSEVGHRKNIQNIFGLDDNCRVVNPTAPALSQLQASFDSSSLRKRDGCSP